MNPPHYQDATVTLHHGDCLDVLRELPDASVDAVVTDPPYGLGFMGKEWDDLPPGLPFAVECLRVLKPGGHLLAFGGTRTWHRLAVAVEDAGFDIRDSIAWMYGSGFPKSLDVSKAIDKRRDWSLVERLSGEIRRARAESGLSLAEIGQATLAATDGTYGKWYHRGGHMFFETGRSLPSRPEWDQLRHVLPIAPKFAEVYDEAEREVVGVQRGAMSGWNMDGTTRFVDRDITAPATPDAEQWQGWGTALKPAFEPVVVARKPLVGTVAANVLAHGTGALNIDGCRVGDQGGTRGSNFVPNDTGIYNHGIGGRVSIEQLSAGRWPANVVLDEDQAAALDEQSGVLTSPGSYDYSTPDTGNERIYGNGAGVPKTARREGFADQGGASRFFYVAKADASERVRVNGTAHPTVKPLALMRWLVRLVTPPGGTVLEPFAGSGTTVEACILEGFHCVAIERETDYLPLIQQRIHRRRDPVQAVKGAGEDGGLFDLLNDEESA